MNYYDQKGQNTRSQRRAAGKYVTPAQKLAFIALINGGEKCLSRQAFELLATHPNLTVSQRSYFAKLAQEAATP